MEGAAWNPGERSICESAPKKLFATLPVLLLSAVTKNMKKTLSSSSEYGAFGPYDCPVYKYPIRTDKYLIFSIMLPTHEHKPLHWTLRGVALLCSTA
jgi:dynein heavy chain